MGGVFTEGSLSQLKSVGFEVLYFDYNAVLEAFYSAGIDASFEEGTPDTIMAEKVIAYEKLSVEQVNGIENFLLEKKKTEVDKFIQNLSKVVVKGVKYVTINTFHGCTRDLASLEEGWWSNSLWV